MAPGNALLRRAAARGRIVAGGVDARHAFSRGDAIDRAWMGWGALRVLSTQAWAPGAVGEAARIANMDLVLLVLEGRLRIDCAGFDPREVTARGAAWIGAGHGMDCRLANASATAPLRLLEAWIQPDRVNAAPGIAVAPASATASGAWLTLAAGGEFHESADRADRADREGCDGVDGAAGDDRPLLLRQDARLRSARLEAGASLALDAVAGRRGWLQLLEGAAAVDGQALSAGDGLAWDAHSPAPATLVALPGAATHALLFELPA
ncbi:hypothetical protein [Luteimonas sp. MC1572]|uniref:pirin family protein n=1 Tax=Luteimonas sp. MC1572 TaxID=2799325 RepID=UPI0018F0F754|nr:hypothetical protein [Luteimonas sp. MC1572]MBJ6981521.1 hypothetical protein [Luteimonas sp. MC1572]QQO02822.1 hypothetical protein JGR64_11745 [Luteimonas sp. MC1572]